MTSYLKYKKTLLCLLLLTICSQAVQGAARPTSKRPTPSLQPPPRKGIITARPTATKKPKTVDAGTQSDESGIIKNSNVLINELEKETSNLENNEQIKKDGPIKQAYTTWTNAQNEAIEKTETWEAALAAKQEAQDNQNPSEFGPVVEEEEPLNRANSLPARVVPAPPLAKAGSNLRPAAKGR